ncbi:MAG TPA: phospholipid carrier-dependent glycosyltransferase [Firmicutes bacterium]|nr:phospholipid carrier-dependent glycosyltransferase [Bacillota bacterium]
MTIGGRTLRERAYIVILLAASVVLFFAKVGMPLTDGDTAYYAKIARNVVESRDWLTLHFLDSDFVDKPPLSIWGIAVSYKLFGVSDWATRGWHSALAVACVLLTYALARRFYPPMEAFLGAGLLACSLLFAYMGQVPQQDVPLLFASLVAFWGFVRYLQTGRLADGLWFFVGSALGVLDRGLQGVVLPGAVAVAYAGFRGWRRLPVALGAEENGAGAARLQRTLAPALALGGVVFLVLSVPWFYYGYVKQGPAFLDYFFGRGNLRYYQEIAPSSPWSALSYFPMLLAAVMPWTAFAFPALVLGWRQAFDKEGSLAAGEGRAERDAAHFFGVWFLAAFLIPFGIKWRVIRYLLPALPPLAILTGHFLGTRLTDATEGRDDAGLRSAAGGTLALAGLFVLALAAVARPLPQAQAGFVPVALPFLSVFVLALAGSALAILVLRRPRLSLAVMAVGALLAYLVLFTQAERHHYLLNPWPEPARVVNAEAGPGDRVLYAGGWQNPFVHYYVKRPVELVSGESLAETLRQEARGGGGRVFLLGEGGALDAYLAVPWEAPVEVRRFPGGVILAVVGQATR